MSERWEYKVMNSKDAEGGGFMKPHTREELEAYLNALGREGWEIVHMDFSDLTISSDHLVFAGLARRRIVDGLPRPASPPE